MRRESYATFEISRFRVPLHANWATTWSVILCLILAASLRAQERVRTAEGKLPIQAFARPPESFFYFGPFEEELAGTVGVRYTDNVELTATNKISDLSYFQRLSLNTTWVISHLNQLRFNFGGELIENFYGNGRSQLTFGVDPNSMVEFKFTISDVQVRLYDQFSYTQDPTTNPTATNTANLNNLTNTIGAVVDADLNLAVLTFSADYTYNDQSGTNVQGQTNPTTSGTRESFRAGPALTFRLSPTILYGLSVQATRSTGVNSSNVNTLNAGPFIRGKLSKNFEFDLSAGGTYVDTKPSIPSTYYFSALGRYQLNPHCQLVFSGSHDLIFTTGTDLTEEYVFRIGTELDITRAISFNAAPFVNHGSVKSAAAQSGISTGPYTQFGFEAGLVWKPRKRWSAALTYDYIRRESGSTVAGTTSQNYIENSIALSLRYAF